jgi:hypothetical protein
VAIPNDLICLVVGYPVASHFSDVVPIEIKREDALLDHAPILPRATAR